MKKPIILLSMSFSSEEDAEFPRISTSAAYADAIVQAGGLPICCPYVEAEIFAAMADGLLLTGGMDIDPARFGEEPLNDTVEVTPARDDYEWELLGHFIRNGKPILGVCRGMQLLSTYLGGSMYQDMPAQLDRNHSKTTHGVVSQLSPWRQYFGERFTVNSFHHQAIKELGQGLTVTVTADDGTVEAVEGAGGLWQACQWHPERMLTERDGCPSMLQIFVDFVNKCK